MDEKLLDDPGWWRALPFTARLTDRPPRTTEEDRAYGRLRKAYWDSGALSGGRPVSLERWERAAGDVSVLDLLAESASSLAERVERPDYVEILEAAWTRADPLPWTEPARVLDAIRPLVRWAEQTLASLVAERLGTVLPDDHPLLRPPTERLAAMLAPTAALEINVAREEGRLTAGTAEENYTAFCERLRDPAGALRFLAEYPVLAAELVSTVRSWIAVCVEFAERFTADLPALRERFGVACGSLAELADVRFEAGDRHVGGRSVAILTFADGGRLVYKPRSVEVEVGYHALLHWLNAHGLAHELKALRVLPRDGYGWVEFAEARPCDRAGEVERFFWRQGAYLALFYSLCGGDLHHENVIASGEHPVIVDVEALFQATPRAFGLGDDEPLLTAAVKAMRDSVLRVGLLPDHVIRKGVAGAYGADISGLTGGGGRLSMLPSLVLKDRGTDRMRIARERLPLNDSTNRAMLDGAPVDLADYSDRLLEGFTACYRLLMRHRDDLLAADGPLAAFAGARIRTLLRPTASYAKLLGESWHPDVLRDALDRAYLFESLSIALQGIDDAERILESEIRQLQRQDIPFFFTTVDGTDLYDDEGVVLADFFDRSGIDLARARLGGLSEDDLARQRWFIEASLTGTTIGEFQPRPRETAELPADPLNLEQARRAAAFVADRLLGWALEDETSPAPSWLSVTFVGDRYWKVAPTGADLYGGLAGIALFLAELDAVSPDRRYRTPAMRIARHLGDLTDHLVEQRIAIPTLGAGAYTGLAGPIHLFAELGRLWADDDLTERAYRLVRHYADAWEHEGVVDLLSGAAGVALVCAALHRRRPSEETHDLLLRAGRFLDEQRIDDGDTTAWPTDMETRRPLLGLSHGTSGIALGAAAIAEVTGKDAYADLAVRALRFERRHLAPDRGNWPDFRSFVSGTVYRDTWCHGAAGIGLARAALSHMVERVPGLGEAQGLLHDDLAIAAATVEADLVRDGAHVGLGNDSLCHGDLGLIETLQAAAVVLDRPDLSLLGRRCAHAIAERVLEGDLRCGTPDRLSAPGLMFGVAGIGHGLLRAAAPETVSDVLLLASATDSG